MKKYIVFVVFLLAAVFLQLECSAAPFLTCDPYVSPTTVVGYKIQIDGGAWNDIGSIVDTQGRYVLKFDLGGMNLADGTHAINIKAYNVWGESPITPFSFSKGVPTAPPATMRLSAQ
jgi:hypothetical protein